MHETTVLSSHRKQDLLEWIRVVIDQCEDATELKHEMIQESAIDVCLDSINQEW